MRLHTVGGLTYSFSITIDVRVGGARGPGESLFFQSTVVSFPGHLQGVTVELTPVILWCFGRLLIGSEKDEYLL